MTEKVLQTYSKLRERHAQVKEFFPEKLQEYCDVWRPILDNQKPGNVIDFIMADCKEAKFSDDQTLFSIFAGIEWMDKQTEKNQPINR